MKLLEAENRDEFTEALLYNPRTARMLERSGHYVGGMDKIQKDVFFEAAVEWGWNNRHSYNAQYQRLEVFWDRCLRAAALTRDRWLISVSIGPGVFEKRWILGVRLGRY